MPKGVYPRTKPGHWLGKPKEFQPGFGKHSNKGQPAWNKGKKFGPRDKSIVEKQLSTISSLNFREERSKKYKELYKNKLIKRTNYPSLKESRKFHTQNVSDQIDVYRANGFRCIRTDIKPIPDFIAIKDSKAYAVEVEDKNIIPFSKISKYKDNDPNIAYSDIIWILMGKKSE